jgi:isopentenyl phosphate kinase
MVWADQDDTNDVENNEEFDDLEIILVKIGGSSITEKGQMETLNEQGLQWFAQTLGKTVGRRFLAPTTTITTTTKTTAEGNTKDIDETITTATGRRTTKSDSNGTAKQRRDIAYIVIHGAGSFGHFQAKEYGLKGPPPRDATLCPTATTYSTTTDTASPTTTATNTNTRRDVATNTAAAHTRFQMKGVAETRRSVQKLNQLVVSRLIDYGSINAIGISPGFGLISQGARNQPQHSPSRNNNNNNKNANEESENPNNPHSFLSNAAVTLLKTVLDDTLRAGLIPVLHGDVCLYNSHGITSRSSTSSSGTDSGTGPAAVIVSGDILMEVLGGGRGSPVVLEQNDSVPVTIDAIKGCVRDRILPISRSVFITDVDGVFTKDPREDDQAELVRHIWVDRDTGDLFPANGSTTTGERGATLASSRSSSTTTTTTEVVVASGSSHAHDVTGGLKVRITSGHINTQKTTVAGSD